MCVQCQCCTVLVVRFSSVCCAVVLGVQVCSCRSCLGFGTFGVSGVFDWGCCSLLLMSPILSSPIKALDIKLLPAWTAISNKSQFFCALVPLQKHSPSILSTIICPLFLFLSYFPSLLPSTLFILLSLFALCCFAAQTRPLITPPIGCAPLALRWLVSFTRVSPVSSLSLCQSPAPTAWTCAQPQHWPTEERHDHLCVGRRSSRPFNGENTSWNYYHHHWPAVETVRIEMYNVVSTEVEAFTADSCHFPIVLPVPFSWSCVCVCPLNKYILYGYVRYRYITYVCKTAKHELADRLIWFPWGGLFVCTVLEGKRFEYI